MTVMRHEIPTHLNVEDRAFYGLSVRQVMVLTVGFSGAYALWSQWPDLLVPARLALAGACLLLTATFALVRPDGRTLEEWAIVALRYLVLRKVAIWRPREPDLPSWRPPTEHWEELSPTLTWTEEGR